MLTRGVIRNIVKIIKNDEIKEVRILNEILRQETYCVRFIVFAVIILLESIFKISKYSLFKVEEKAFVLRSYPIKALSLSNNQIPSNLSKAEKIFARAKITKNGINNCSGAIIPNEIAKFLSIGIFQKFSGVVISDNKGINEAKENISPKPVMHINRYRRINCFFLVVDK